MHPLIAWEHQTEHAIAVPEDVRVVHRQIRATREYRAAQKRGEIKYGENKLPNLNVRVSNAALPRALILPYEWITESRSHRRFMVPAEIVNAHGVIARLQTAE